MRVVDFHRHRLSWHRRQARRWLFRMTWLAMALYVTLFGWMFVDVVRGAVAHLLSEPGVACSIGWLPWQFLRFLAAVPEDFGRQGGVGPMVISTLGVTAICLLTAVPLALGTAIFLSEYCPDSPYARWLHWSLDVMAGVPSIVFGLVGQTLFCRGLGLGYSLWAGGLTLACMVLPLLIRVWQTGLQAVPREQRLAAASLGLSPSTVVLRVVLPQAIPSLLAGVVLAIGRVVAESAALIYTSGMVMRVPRSPWDSGRTLAVHIYDLALHVPGGIPAAYAVALALVAIVSLLNVVTVWLLTGYRIREEPVEAGR